MSFSDGFDWDVTGTRLDAAGNPGWTETVAGATYAYLDLTTTTGGGVRSATQAGSGNALWTCTGQGSDNHETIGRIENLVGSVYLFFVVRAVDQNNWIGYKLHGTGASGLRYCSCSSGTLTEHYTTQGAANQWVKAVANGTNVDFHIGGTSATPSWGSSLYNLSNSSSSTYQGIALQTTGSTAAWGYFEAAALSAGTSIEVPQGNLSLTTSAPTVQVSGGVAIEVPQANLSLSTLAPTLVVSDNQAILVPQGTLTLSTTAPDVVVTASGQIIVPSADLSLSTTAPSVTLSENVSVEVPQGNLALSSTAPAVSVNWNIVVPQANLALSTTAPSVLQGFNIFVPSGNLVLSTTAPSVSLTTAASIVVPQANLSLSTTAPIVQQTGLDIWIEVSAVSNTWTEIV